MFSGFGATFVSGVGFLFRTEPEEAQDLLQKSGLLCRCAVLSLLRRRMVIVTVVLVTTTARPTTAAGRLAVLHVHCSFFLGYNPAEGLVHRHTHTRMPLNNRPRFSGSLLFEQRLQSGAQRDVPPPGAVGVRSSLPPPLPRRPLLAFKGTETCDPPPRLLAEPSFFDVRRSFPRPKGSF